MGNKMPVHCCCANEEDTFKGSDLKEISPANNLEEEMEAGKPTTDSLSSLKGLAATHRVHDEDKLGTPVNSVTGEIRVFISRNPGDKLGLVIAHFGDLGILQVKDIKQNGLIATWNRLHPDRPVEIGAHILEMNCKKVAYMTEGDIGKILEATEPIDMVCTRQRSMIPITDD
mmetsp:Transcript_34417/g.78459  ORF Transcript_34417/g.78459 Transcript_34417/m.78459 type:complete len:172 (-) Transcript_34417:217-732(-)